MPNFDVITVPSDRLPFYEGKKAWEIGYREVVTVTKAYRCSAKVESPRGVYKTMWARLLFPDKPEVMESMVGCEETFQAGELAIACCLPKGHTMPHDSGRQLSWNCDTEGCSCRALPDPKPEAEPYGDGI